MSRRGGVCSRGLPVTPPLTTLALGVVAETAVGQPDLEDLPVEGDADADGRDVDVHGGVHRHRHMHAVLAEVLAHPHVVEQDLGTQPGTCNQGWWVLSSGPGAPSAVVGFSGRSWLWAALRPRPSAPIVPMALRGGVPCPLSEAPLELTSGQGKRVQAPALCGGPRAPCTRTHQALFLPVGVGDGGEDNLRGLIVDTEGAGAGGGGCGGPTEVVVQEDGEVPVAWADLPHDDVGAVVPERVGGAVEGDVVGAPPATAGACGHRQSPHTVPPRPATSGEWLKSPQPQLPHF